MLLFVNENALYRAGTVKHEATAAGRELPETNMGCNLPYLSTRSITGKQPLNRQDKKNDWRGPYYRKEDEGVEIKRERGSTCTWLERRLSWWDFNPSVKGVDECSTAD